MKQVNVDRHSSQKVTEKGKLLLIIRVLIIKEKSLHYFV